jgi:hypothetical protein
MPRDSSLSIPVVREIPGGSMPLIALMKLPSAPLSSARSCGPQRTYNENDQRSRAVSAVSERVM